MSGAGRVCFPCCCGGRAAARCSGWSSPYLPTSPHISPYLPISQVLGLEMLSAVTDLGRRCVAANGAEGEVQPGQGRGGDTASLIVTDELIIN